MRRVGIRAAVCVGVALLAGAVAATGQTLTDPGLSVETIRPGLNGATGMRFLAHDDAFVIERTTGKVKRLQGASATEVLDLDVISTSERGLLGIELHPNFDPDTPGINDYVYLYYSVPMAVAGGGVSWAGNRLSRFTWNGTNLVSETELFSIDFDASQDFGSAHNGGPLRFGPDGTLYLVTGDLVFRNRAEQNNTFEAETSALTGGVYRFNDDGSIPTDNPFLGHPNSDFHGLYAYGVRNSFGIAFDPVTGRLWDTENGANSMDEINMVEAGFNSGWRVVMGPSSGSSSTEDLVDLITGMSTYSDPEFTFVDTIGVTSIAFLAGSALGPAYDDRVLVGDSFGRLGNPFNGALYLFELNQTDSDGDMIPDRDGFVLTGDLADLVEDPGDDISQILLGTNFGVITDIEIDPDGFVYVLSEDGSVHIVPEPSFGATVWSGLAALAVMRRWRNMRLRRPGRKRSPGAA